MSLSVRVYTTRYHVTCRRTTLARVPYVYDIIYVYGGNDKVRYAAAVEAATALLHPSTLHTSNNDDGGVGGVGGFARGRKSADCRARATCTHRVRHYVYTRIHNEP